MPVFERVAFAPNYLGYLEGFELQKKVHAEVVAGKRADTVLLLEHQSVYTAGKRTELSELPSDGSEFVETNRGGKITWHGPGQLVAIRLCIFQNQSMLSVMSDISSRY